MRHWSQRLAAARVCTLGSRKYRIGPQYDCYRLLSIEFGIRRNPLYPALQSGCNAQGGRVFSSMFAPLLIPLCNESSGSAITQLMAGLAWRLCWHRWHDRQSAWRRPPRRTSPRRLGNPPAREPPSTSLARTDINHQVQGRRITEQSRASWDGSYGHPQA